jgi:hypothetical protein
MNLSLSEPQAIKSMVSSCGLRTSSREDKPLDLPGMRYPPTLIFGTANGIEAKG